MGASKNQKNTYNEMGREEKYISLKEAAQYSRVYSQDYLSLRARQGKLQAVKMGRNWVTKKEWIDQYLNEVNEFKNGKQKEVKEAPVRDKKTDKEIAKILKPKKTSFIFRKKKAIGLVLGSLLLISLFSFGYSKYEPVLEKLGKGIEQVSSKITLSLARLVFISSDKDETIPPDEDYVKQKTKEDIFSVSLPKIHKTRNGFFAFLKTLQHGALGIGSGLKESLFHTSAFIKHIPEYSVFGLKHIKDFLLGSYQILEYNVRKEQMEEEGKRLALTIKREEAKIKDSTQGFQQNLKDGAYGIQKELVSEASFGLGSISNFLKQGYEDIKIASGHLKENAKEGLSFFLRPWKKQETEVVFQPTLVPEPPSQLVREIITQVQPVTTYVEKVIKADEQELNALNNKLAEMKTWEVEINDLRNLFEKLQYHSPANTVVTSPVYIGSQGIEIGGAATLSSLVVSGLAGFRHLSVGESTTLGSDSSDVLTVNATGDFISPVSFKEEVTFGSDTAYLTIDAFGNLETTGNITASGNVTISGTLTISDILSLMSSSSDAILTVNQTGSGNILDLQGQGVSLLSLSSEGDMTISGTTTALTFISSSTDSTVRKTGEEIFRASASIYRYDIPSQTSTTTYFRISKTIDTNPLASSPDVLPGAVRVYRLIIKYSDDIASTSSSSWRIYRPNTDETAELFTLTGREETDLKEGLAYVTDVLDIPDTDFRIDVQVPDPSNSIRVFQVFLAAYDRIN